MRRLVPLLALVLACGPAAEEPEGASEGEATVGAERAAASEAPPEARAEGAGADEAEEDPLPERVQARPPTDGSATPPRTATGTPPVTRSPPAGPRVCPPPGLHDLPDAGGYPGMARLVWTGAHYLQLWYERESDGRDFRLFVQRLGPRLEPLGQPRRLFPNTPAQSSRALVQVALGDGVVGLVYKHSRTELRTPPARSGPPDGMPPRPTPFGPQRGPQPTLVSIEARFLRLGLDGRPLGPERAVAPDAAPWNGDHAALAWDPETRRWGVAFEGSEPGGGNRRLYFAQLDESGELAEDPVALSSERYLLGSAGQSVIARPGGGFAVTWGDRHPMLAEVTAGGVRRLELGPMDGGGEAAVTTDGSHYAVAFAMGTPRAVQLAWAEVGGDPLPELGQTIGATGRYSGSVDLRFGAEGLELVYVQQDARRRSRIDRRVLTPGGLRGPTPLTADDQSVDSHGWPAFPEGDAPCPGMFSYLAFGDGASLRAFVPGP
ncbi:MAG TPA: hypothetical protein RMH85_29170 [Polyangiaceae bacterium LLY-WYZ-15_(1-7)]|nr:hypothetical protein [Myxococcales bacterium]HJL06532.1 hypothetical protein [Polyangiaceae bacterium LLY-WYZ-15_(1-7)]HJL12587.1 hypothetical protein [Polyangiaceae bacterium LLY-WYZ-15_(1-7)]HJL37392.1 hypothetical protein [Polyangiaceae bacterium LLY-WYZ-15_(1-7)]